MKLLVCLLFSIVFSIDIARYEKFLDNPDGDTWAVLVAGANQWSNYWSQAQICQAYQQLHQAGVPDSNIIVWMYDDIANNPSNPHKGEIFLYDGGPEVYKGTPKDAIGKDIIPSNFWKLLKGEDITFGTGKKLASQKNDRIFVYYSDHGGPGVIYFPGFVEGHLKDFTDSLQHMHDNNMYKEMIIYLDTCESGSMFNGHLPEEWNIYAATSVDPKHPAWLCDCFTWIKGACTSNCWPKYYLLDTLESMKNGSFETRTFEDQYYDLQNETLHPNPQWPQNTQQSCRYGNFDISKDNALYMFHGTGEKGKVERRSFKKEGSKRKEHAVDVRNAKYFALKNVYERENSKEAHEEMKAYEKMMEKTDLIWDTFASVFAITKLQDRKNDLYDCWPKDKIKPECMKEAIEAAKRSCGGFNEYSSVYLHYLNDYCQSGKDLGQMEDLLMRVCSVVRKD